jgi:Zn-dependent peptidase ImmA (M78 family)
MPMILRQAACILINANHGRKRRIQIVSHRSHADILDEEEVSVSTEERFAKRFGSAFLMPASGVRARFDQIVVSQEPSVLGECTCPAARSKARCVR